MSTLEADVIKMSPENVIEHYKDGDEIGWPYELMWLWTEHRKQLLALMDSVLKDGFQEPIILGNDGRVWDGHHRLAVALALGMRLPVDVVKPLEDQ